MPDKSNLALAMSKAQGMMKAAKKDSSNPFFKSKYADLSSVWDACREALSQNEIAVFQKTGIVDGVFGIITKIIHSSGDYEEGFFPIAARIEAKAQEMGSAVTYARRYALAAMVGVAPEDDDGNEAQKTQPERIEKKQNETDFAKKYAQDISLCQTVEEIDALVKSKATDLSRLASTLPKWHERIVQLLDEKRKILEIPQ